MSTELTNYKELWTSYKEKDSKNPPIIELQNINHIPVGAIYLKTINTDEMRVALSTTNNEEKYAFYYGGIMIFFSYFRKISR